MRLSFIKTYKAFKNIIDLFYQIKIRHSDFCRVQVRRSNLEVKIPTSFLGDLEKLVLNPSVNLLDFHNEIITFKFRQKNIKIWVCDSTHFNGDIGAVFGTEDYAFLNTENSILIDIGANIGDSAIYFIVNGCEKVFALEPVDYFFEIASKNIQINQMNEDIQLIKAGYGRDSYVRIRDDITWHGGGANLNVSDNGKEIEIISLEKLIEKYNLTDNNLLLKMDCEGCEYDLLNEKKDTIRKFKKIAIEYHYGYEKLFNKLIDSGFTVKYTLPEAIYNDSHSNPHLLVGMIYAERIESNTSVI